MLLQCLVGPEDYLKLYFSPTGENIVSEHFEFATIDFFKVTIYFITL